MNPNNNLVNQYRTEFFTNGTRHSISAPSAVEVQNQVKMVLRTQGEVRFERSDNNTVLVYVEGYQNGREPICSINELEIPATLSVAWQTKKASEKVAA